LWTLSKLINHNFQWSALKSQFFWRNKKSNCTEIFLKLSQLTDSTVCHQSTPITNIWQTSWIIHTLISSTDMNFNVIVNNFWIYFNYFHYQPSVFLFLANSLQNFPAQAPINVLVVVTFFRFVEAKFNHKWLIRWRFLSQLFLTSSDTSNI
jgi:hypothetical protein